MTFASRLHQPMVPAIDDSVRKYAHIARLSTPSLPDIELWWADLDLYAAQVPLEGLSANERTRAASFVLGANARRFLARRHALRAILATRTGLNPEAIVFRTGRFGKSLLDNTAELQFSCSQSGSEAVVAVCEGQPVGVDVEIVREVVDADALAQLHFTTSERAAWLEEAGGRANRAFLTCWTRKEACVKALGLGFRLSPECVDVGCSNGVRVVELLDATEPHEVEVDSLPSPARGIVAVARLKSSTRLPADWVLTLP
jgi:4'-phosphopantetheinyl transferase